MLGYRTQITKSELWHVHQQSSCLKGIAHVHNYIKVILMFFGSRQIISKFIHLFKMLYHNIML